jgi:hypothetical protein
MAPRTRQDVEKLAVAYLEALRRVSERDHWAQGHRLPLKDSAKVGATAYLLENGCAVLTFKAGVAEDFWRAEAVSFDALKAALEPREYDHLVVLYPSMMDDDATLEAVASEACARAIASPNWAAGLKAAGADVREVRAKIAELFKANPWLEKTLTETSSELGTQEERITALSTERAAAETRRGFEACEDAVERAERFRVDGAGERLSKINEHTAELFAKELLKTYRKQVETSGLPSGEEPPLYRAYPYRIEALLLSNKTLLLCVRRSPQAAGFAALPSDYAKAKALLDDPSGAFVLAWDNDARLEAPEARFLGEQVAAADVEDARSLAKVKQAAEGLGKAEKEITSAGKINPWLEPQTMKLTATLSRARKALEQVASGVDSTVEKGAVVRTEAIRANLEVAPHGLRAVLAPADPAASSRPSGPRAAARDAAAVSASTSAAGTTKASAPTVVNVPEGADHVFQEVDYYNFPQSAAVRSAEAASSVSAPVVDLAPPPPPPAGAVDAEMRAKAYDLEMRLNEYERRLYYMDKYTEMLQKQQLDKVKLLRELIKVEGKRNRARAYGISVAALAGALLALLAVWPATVAAISAFFHGLGL